MTTVIFAKIFVFIIHNKEKHDEDSSLDCPNRDCDDDDDGGDMYGRSTIALLLRIRASVVVVDNQGLDWCVHIPTRDCCIV